MKLIFTALLLTLVGCAGTYKDFKPTDDKAGSGIAVGRVRVIYNGKDKNADCGVCLNSVNGPCQKLTPEGYVFENLPVGPASLRRITCKDTSLQHFNLEGATFQVSAGAITYFGDLEIRWTNGGGFKVTDLFGALGAVISESKSDGKIKVTVVGGDLEELAAAYERVTGSAPEQFSKSLVKIDSLK